MIKHVKNDYDCSDHGKKDKCGIARKKTNMFKDWYLNPENSEWEGMKNMGSFIYKIYN